MVFVITTEISASTSWSVASSATPSGEIVNRAQKGDRLPVIPTLHRNTANLPLKRTEQTDFIDPELPVGCESVASFLSHSLLAHIAGRCLS
jgi:hypothetical protein